MTTGNDVQASWIAYLKTKTSLTSLLSNTGQVKERQWQGDDFVYPAVRVSVDFFPSMGGCIDRAEVYVQVFSEQKSSIEASNIAGVIQGLVHRRPFESAGVKSFSVIVEKVDKPERSIFAWESKLKVNTLIA